MAQSAGDTETWAQEMQGKVAYAREYLAKLKTLPSFDFQNDQSQIHHIFGQAFHLGLALHSVVISVALLSLRSTHAAFTIEDRHN
jgi:hypothetical protein